MPFAKNNTTHTAAALTILLTVLYPTVALCQTATPPYPAAPQATATPSHTGTLLTQTQDLGKRMTLSLRDAVNLSLKQNPEVTIARIRIDESKSRSRVALSELLPEVALTSDIYIWRFNGQSFFGSEQPSRVGPFQVIDIGPAGTQSVLDLPRVRRFQQSRENVRTSTFDERTTRETIVSAVVRQYLEILRAVDAEQAAESRVAVAQRLYDQARDQQNSGIGTGIDTLRSQVELLNEKQRLIEAQSAVNTSQFALADTLDLPRDVTFDCSDRLEEADMPIVSVDELIDEAINSRPELLSLRSMQKASHFAERAAVEEHLPKISFTGYWDYQGRVYGDGVPSYRYQTDLTLPLFTGGRIRALVAEAKLDQRRESEEDRALRARVTREVKTAVDQFEAAKAALDVANLAFTLAEREVEQAGRRFKEGVTTNVDVIQAQDALARASDNRIQSLFQLNIERAALSRATGSIENTYSH